MSLIKPLRGLRPAADHAGAVAAPPYDVLSTEEARVRAAGKPWSFLHISKPEIDLPADTDPYSPAVYAKASENLRQMLAAGILHRDATPCYYGYELRMGHHRQLGFVAAASVAAYDTGRVKKHEFTRPDKEDDRVRQIDALNAQTGPVLLAYPDAPAADRLLAQACAGTPAAEVTADDGIRHTIWVIGDEALIRDITAAFDALPALYIADGHHRSAAASRVAAARRKPGIEQSSDYFSTACRRTRSSPASANPLPWRPLAARWRRCVRARSGCTCPAAGIASTSTRSCSRPTRWRDWM
jgi:uncharacterized protein (DUF1015 family)